MKLASALEAAASEPGTLFAVAGQRPYRLACILILVAFASTCAAAVIPKQAENVATDVQMARGWRLGSIDEAKIKRMGTEAGFRK